MLTRDLLRFRASKGVVRPTFINPRKKDLLEISGDLIEIAEAGVTQTRGVVEEQLDIRVGMFSQAKIARGLKKLILDRTDVEDPGGDIAEARLAAFFEAAAILRGLPEGASYATYDSELDKVSIDREALFSDLPARRTVTQFRSLSATDLLNRYNMAQAQGLAIYASEMTITSDKPDLLAVRRVLRTLKFQRLVAEVFRQGDTWTMRVDGPASILSMQKKYGLQLAQFLPVLPFLGTFDLTAEVSIPKRPKLTLKLSDGDKLVSPHSRAIGHVPPEIEHVARTFEDDRWALDLLPEPRPVGIKGLCVPDMTFRDRQSDRVVYVELFHRWHKTGLQRRLEDLSRRPDPALILGVDRALCSEDHEQVFVFSAFPSPRMLRTALARFE